MPSHIECPNKSCHAKININADVVLGASLAGGMICPTCGSNIPESEFVTQGLLQEEDKSTGTPDHWRGKMVLK